MLEIKTPYRIGIESSLALFALAAAAPETHTINSSEALAGRTISLETSVFENPEWREQSSIEPQLLAQQLQLKTALVIGNAAYPEDVLDNPGNDATDIANALRSLGFEVTLLLDADLRGMDDAIDAFYRQLRQGGVGVFYYAGHGVQVDGENYLIPVDARLSRQNDVRYQALPLGEVLNAMEDSDTQVNVVIIDACRDNPFYRRWRSRNRSLSAARGLALEAPPEGTIISFATAPGDVADDGEGRNSPYTASLLRHISNEGEDVAAMFRRVRADVIRATKSEQRPWYQESLIGSFSFNPLSPRVTQRPLTGQSSSPIAISPVQEDTPPSLPTLTLPAEPTLISTTTGINYQPLRNVLAAGNFREADQATSSLILQAADRESQGYLRAEDVDKFSCEDLRIIDQLWLNYSNGKFGFSIQQEIWQNLGGTSEYDADIWRDFGDRVGWRVNNRWISYGEFTFNIFASRGHLPHILELDFIYKLGMLCIFSSFMQRPVDCRI